MWYRDYSTQNVGIIPDTFQCTYLNMRNIFSYVISIISVHHKKSVCSEPHMENPLLNKQPQVRLYTKLRHFLS